MGITLKLKRIEKGYKQYELAKIIGVSSQYLNALENGRAKNPNLQVMKDIAQALDSTVEELFLAEK